MRTNRLEVAEALNLPERALQGQRLCGSGIGVRRYHQSVNGCMSNIVYYGWSRERWGREAGVEGGGGAVGREKEGEGWKRDVEVGGRRWR